MTKAEKFKTGDIVRLKSGGPDMTVQSYAAEILEGQVVHCRWFNGKKAESGAFREDMLIAGDGKDKNRRGSDD